MPSDHISGENSAQQTQPAGSRLVPPAVRHRLQKLYEHAQRCVAKGDHDYANQLLSQCVSEDPANLIYLQSFLANLQKKYDDNKKGAKFSGLKIKSQRSALSKAAAGGDWPAAFQAGCTALSLNPWDTSTLLAMAAACQELHINECLLFYLRWALDAGGKDPQVNRQAALALQRMGQFDQAIACWHRVEQAKPHDEEALQAISRLSVEKTIQQGGYDPELLTGGGKSQGEGDRKSAVHGASTSPPPPLAYSPNNVCRKKSSKIPPKLPTTCNWPICCSMRAGWMRRKKSWTGPCRLLVVGIYRSGSGRKTCKSVVRKGNWRLPSGKPPINLQPKRLKWRPKCGPRPIKLSWKSTPPESIANRRMDDCSTNWGYG